MFCKLAQITKMSRIAVLLVVLFVVTVNTLSYNEIGESALKRLLRHNDRSVALLEKLRGFEPDSDEEISFNHKKREENNKPEVGIEGIKLNPHSSSEEDHEELRGAGSNSDEVNPFKLEDVEGNMKRKMDVEGEQFNPFRRTVEQGEELEDFGPGDSEEISFNPKEERNMEAEGNSFNPTRSIEDDSGGDSVDVDDSDDGDDSDEKMTLGKGWGKFEGLESEEKRERIEKGFANEDTDEGYLKDSLVKLKAWIQHAKANQ
jgi:hypothetical protein